MDIWERFDETSLPDKESFYSSVDMENIDDIDYRHGNNVFKKFKLKNLGKYPDLYVQSDTLLLADVFENFRNMCGWAMSQKLPVNSFKWVKNTLKID